MLSDFKSRAGAYLEDTSGQVAVGSPVGAAPGAYTGSAPSADPAAGAPTKGPGFFAGLVDSFAKPARELGKDIAELYPEVGSARSFIDDPEASIEHLRGTLSPENFERLRADTVRDAENAKLALGEKPSTRKVIADVLGTALSASIVLPVGALGTLMKASSPFLKAAATGAAYGAAFGAVDRASETGEATKILESAGLGALAGGVTGPATVLLGRGFTRMASMKPFVNLYNRISDSRAMRSAADFVYPVFSVLTRDFGEVGERIVRSIKTADRNTMLALGRIMKIQKDIGATFGADAAGREESYQLGRALRSGAGEAGANALTPGTITGRIAEPGAADVSLGFGARNPITPVVPGEASNAADIAGLSKESFYRALFKDVFAEARARDVRELVPASKGLKARFQQLTEVEDYFPKQVPNIADLKAAGVSYGASGNPLGKAAPRATEGKLRSWVIRNAVDDGSFRSADEAAAVLDSYIEYVERNGVGLSKKNGWASYLVSSGQASNEKEARRLMDVVLKDQGMTRLGGSIEHARVVDNPFYNPFPDEVAPLYAMNSIARFESIGQFGVKYHGASVETPALTEAIDGVRAAHGEQAVEKFGKFLDVALGNINTASREAKWSYFIRALGVPKLTFSQIINIGQPLLGGMLNSDSRATFYGLSRYWTRYGKDVGMESGAAIQSVFNEMVNATVGGGKFSDWYLKKTKFTATELANRTASANSGVEWAREQFGKLLKDPGRTASRFRLEELGIDVDRALKRGSLTGNELLKAGQVFTENTQFRSRPGDMPHWASSNIGKLFWQFKSFSYQQFRLLERSVVEEARMGNYGRATRNVLVLATIFPMVGEVLQDFRSLITGSRRPTGALARYWSDLAGSGAASMVSDVIDAAAGRKFGRVLMPPTFNSIAELINSSGDPKQFTAEILRNLGPGVMISNRMKKKTRGYESMWETLTR